MLDALLLALAPLLPAQQPTPLRLEVSQVPSIAVRAASSDGRWVTGFHVRFLNWPSPVRWSATSGLEALGLPTNDARAISDDGRTVLTRLLNDPYHGLGYTAAVWRPGGLKAFPGVGKILHISPADGFGMSRDGRFVAGSGTPYDPVQPEPETAWLWEVGVAVRTLESPWPGATRACDVSDDGRVVVGLAFEDLWPAYAVHPVLWTDDVIEVLGEDWGGAWGTNADGSVVTGDVGGRPFLWSRARGLRRIDTVAPTASPWLSTFRGKQVSDDGSTVLSRQVAHVPMVGPYEGIAHLWREGAGAVNARELLSAFGADLPDDAQYVALESLGADGRTLVGRASSGGHPESPLLLWRAVLPPSAETYCTAQTSAAGCTPTLGSTGTPSARTGAGFTIHVRGVPSNASGVLAYSTSGAASLPFGGGVLCLAEPTSRIALGDAGGTDACDGALALDFNAVVAAAADPALVGGAAVWAQAWLRQPEAQALPLASDGLMFTLWP